jgi:hypothetical protein
MLDMAISSPLLHFDYPRDAGVGDRHGPLRQIGDVVPLSRHPEVLLNAKSGEYWSRSTR